MTTTSGDPAFVTTEISIDGDFVTRDKIVDAIDILEHHPASTSIRQLLKPSQNPLAYAPYTRIVNAFLKNHPEAAVEKGTRQHHAARQRIPFILYLKERLREADQSIEQAFSEAEEVIEQQQLGSQPLDDIDARDRVLREIAARHGQADFRSELMHAYDARCAVTDCDAEPALEAAHLHPWRGMHSNTLNNGLLLRADIHTLLDRGLLAFHPETRKIILSEKLRKTQYEPLHGKPLAEPAAKSQRPSHEALLWVMNEFQKNHPSGYR